MAKKISQKITESSNRIHEIGNKLLSMDGHEGYKISEIHFSNASDKKIVCRYVYENGKWVYRCLPNNE
jgi:hypothetical protein